MNLEIRLKFYRILGMLEGISWSINDSQIGDALQMIIDAVDEILRENNN